jgi:hypothetical protein
MRRHQKNRIIQKTGRKFVAGVSDSSPNFKTFKEPKIPKNQFRQAV